MCVPQLVGVSGVSHFCFSKLNSLATRCFLWNQRVPWLPFGGLRIFLSSPAAGTETVNSSMLRRGLFDRVQLARRRSRAVFCRPLPLLTKRVHNNNTVDAPTTVSPSAIATVVSAILKHHDADKARSVTKELEKTDKYHVKAGVEVFAARAAVEAASGPSGSSRVTNLVFRQVLQSRTPLTDDLVRQIIRVDLNTGQIEAALAKLDTVLSVVSASPQAGSVRLLNSNTGNDDATVPDIPAFWCS